MLPDSVPDLPDLLPLPEILVAGLELAAGGVGDRVDNVLLLHLELFLLVDVLAVLLLASLDGVDDDDDTGEGGDNELFSDIIPELRTFSDDLPSSVMVVLAGGYDVQVLSGSLDDNVPDDLADDVGYKVDGAALSDLIPDSPLSNVHISLLEGEEDDDMHFTRLSLKSFACKAPSGGSGDGRWVAHSLSMDLLLLECARRCTRWQRVMCWG